MALKRYGLLTFAGYLCCTKGPLQFSAMSKNFWEKKVFIQKIPSEKSKVSSRKGTPWTFWAWKVVPICLFLYLQQKFTVVLGIMQKRNCSYEGLKTLSNFIPTKSVIRGYFRMFCDKRWRKWWSGRLTGRLRVIKSEISSPGLKTSSMTSNTKRESCPIRLLALSSDTGLLILTLKYPINNTTLFGKHSCIKVYSVWASRVNIWEQISGDQCFFRKSEKYQSWPTVWLPGFPSRMLPGFLRIVGFPTRNPTRILQDDGKLSRKSRIPIINSGIQETYQEFQR